MQRKYKLVSPVRRFLKSAGIVFGTLVVVGLSIAAYNAFNVPVVTSIAALQGLGTASSQYSAVIVTGSQGQGSTFRWVSGSLPCNASTGGGDGGTTFCAGSAGNYVTTGYWQRQYAGPVQVPWFEASVGIDDTAATQAALNTGSDVYMPSGNYLWTSLVTINTPYQRLFGSGYLSTNITCTRLTAGNCLTIQPNGVTATSNVLIDDINLHSASANTVKLISVAGPQLTIRNSSLINSGSSGHVVYGEDENSGAGQYEFGLTLFQDVITGNSTTGYFGVRLGLNAQDASITQNVITNCGTAIAIQDAIENGIIEQNTIESMVTYGVDMDHVSSSPLMSNISIRVNYFEDTPTVIHMGAGEFHDIEVKNNYATNSLIGSYFYWADNAHTANAASDNISVEYNYINNFAAAFQLDNEYSSNLRAAKGNTPVSVTAYAAGTYEPNAWSNRTLNNFYLAKLISGSFITQTTIRMESLNAVFQTPVFWDSHEFLDQITFEFISNGAQVSVEFHSVTTAGTTDTTISTTTTSSNGIYVIPVGKYGDPSLNYYLKVTYNNTGTSAYVYPFVLNLRQ